MLNNKSVIFTVVSSLISFALISLSAPLKANDNLHTQSILVAEAHQHGHKSNSQEKREHQHGMMEEKHDYAHRIIFHADKLKLTDEQLGKLVRLHLKYEKEHRKIKEKLKDSMHAFKKAKMDPSSTDEQLLSLGKDHANAFNAMVEHHIQERRAIHSILSTEQKGQLNMIKMNHSVHEDKDGGHSHDH
ncbi:MAG: Spy/CpxP family protein refolding chaperone [Nitrosomonas sp.]|nr:Spy/CpxP family protein refolding chaperone [Nitrosomonas sp.]MBK7365926.1 Spy/CpxP family protein refolding chaperone [Nitrosomonas sp.]